MITELTKSAKYHSSPGPFLINLATIATVEQEPNYTTITMNFQEPGNVDICPATCRVEEAMKDIKSLLIDAGLFLYKDE